MDKRDKNKLSLLGYTSNTPSHREPESCTLHPFNRNHDVACESLACNQFSFLCAWINDTVSYVDNMSVSIEIQFMNAFQYQKPEVLMRCLSANNIYYSVLCLHGIASCSLLVSLKHYGCTNHWPILEKPFITVTCYPVHFKNTSFWNARADQYNPAFLPTPSSHLGGDGSRFMRIMAMPTRCLCSE